MFRRKKKQEEAAKAPPKTLLQHVQEWVKAFVFAFAVMVPLRASLIDWFDVPSGSMEPTIVPGDRIFVNKLAYGLRVPLTDEPCRWIARWDSPSRGEVVICYSPDPDPIRLVKRVVAVGGDTLELREGKLVINGKEAEYAALDEEIQNQIDGGRFGIMRFALETTEDGSHPTVRAPNDRDVRIMEQGGRFVERWGESRWTLSNFGPITVPAGKVFVMGDSRDKSRDSRFFGYIDETQVVGRSPTVVFSFLLKPRISVAWDRFFRAIP